MSDLYTGYYANSRHDGFIDASSNAAGVAAWRRRIDPQKTRNAEARLILSTGSVLIVDGMREIYAFSASGERLWQRPKRPGTQVALHNNLVYLFSRDYINYLEAVNPENELKIEGAPIPDVGEDAHLVMLEPTDDGLIAQVQYTDQPDFVTSEVLVYMITHDSPIYAWCKGFPERESPLVPFVCTRLRRLVTSLPGEALVFDLDSGEDTPEPVFRYPFPLGDGTVWISCGTDGNIYWAGYNSNSTLLAATDFSGEQVWRWESAGVVSLPRRNPIAPAIISPDGVFLLTPKSLLAIKDGRLKWVFESVRGEFRECTALADGTVLLTTWDTLYRLNDRGEILFSEIMDEPLATPPVVDDKGRAYVASAETLYAIG